MDRSTRFVLLLQLPDDISAVASQKAMTKAIQTHRLVLMKSITWDHGSELARHKNFSLITGIPVFLLDSHSPWRRGLNENTNGPLRQHLPKGTDLKKYSADDLKKIQRRLNGRPGKTLGYEVPEEKLNELVAVSR
ncbi:integrase core domain protein [Acidithrix ferrooxidans]|uniref:Integrase core domain protein n=1 Tax=Acidithrix ferrooxidans TaxID=1280514 RepID=A0A0D8HCT8_9ACTN|nr:integrase core domain protein [Acidithrix ferrooxidans]